MRNGYREGRSGVTPIDIPAGSAEPLGARPAVLFLALAAGLGGSTRSLMTVLRHLGPNIDRVLAGPGTGKFQSLIKDQRLSERYVPLWRPRRRALDRLSRPMAAAKLATWLWRHRHAITAVHANGPEELNVALPGSWITGIPIVVWSHARDASPWMRRLAPIWRLVARRHPIRWAAVSTSARDVLVDGGLTKPPQVAIVPNPIDPADIASTHHPDPRQVTIGYLGSDAQYKGFQFLPDVVHRLIQTPLRWLLFSEPRSSANAHVWSRLRSFPHGLVTLVGKVSDVRSAYAQCDIVFCPSLEESFCRVAAEAMLNGLPVVASDLRAVREVLGDSEAGILFPPGDTASAAESILQLVHDPGRRKAMGEAGRVRAASFSPEAVVMKLADLYGLTLMSLER